MTMTSELPGGWSAPGPWIDGTWVTGAADALSVLSPSTGEVVAAVGAANPDVVAQAVASARASFADKRWRAIPVLSRQRILSDVAQLLRRHDVALSHLIATDMGMPQGIARFVEVPMAASVFDYYAAMTSRRLGETVPVDVPGAPPDYLAYTLHQPIGVAGLITPWNFPLLIPAWKIAPALAAGCSVVLKPAPETPRIALVLAQLLQEAGVPDGVVNVVPGGDEAGEALVKHPGVAKISLTGETATGRRVMANAAPQLKRLSLELGGKSPALVFADADLDQAVSQCLFGIYFNSGQVCQAGSRILVEESVYPAFLERFVARAQTLRVGSATDPATDLGPMVREDRLQRMAVYIQEAASRGARVLIGGEPLPGPGYYFPATVVAEATPAMRLAQEEVFGPVAAVMPFATDAQALSAANDTWAGLAAAVFTRDVRRALRLADELEAGTVWINASQILSPTLPFGGWKASGLGRELGEEGLAAFLETKSVVVDLNPEPMTFF